MTPRELGGRGRRRDVEPVGELGDLDVRIVGTEQTAGDVAAMLRGRGITVRGPYPRRREAGRVSYYARLAAGEPMTPAAAGELPARPAIAGPTTEDEAPR